MSNTSFQLGQGQPAAKLPCHCVTLDYDTNKTRADILADALAELTSLGITAPTGKQFDLVSSNVGVYSKGAQYIPEGGAAAITVTNPQVVTVTSGGDTDLVNPGGQLPTEVDVQDADCDGFADNTLPADYAIAIPVDGAARVRVCLSVISV